MNSARNEYLQLEEATFRMMVVRDLNENDTDHTEMREEAHRWVTELKEALRAEIEEEKKKGEKRDLRVSKLTGIFYSLLVAITGSVVTAVILSQIR